MIIHIIWIDAASMSVESVIKPLVSTYEGRNEKCRPLSEERELQMMISVNGPALEHADKVKSKHVKLLEGQERIFMALCAKI